jgi:DNA-directed RNA polymerase subunit RPC12/RpoP
LVFCHHCSKEKRILIPLDQLIEGNRCPACKYQIRMKNA